MPNLTPEEQAQLLRDMMNDPAVRAEAQAAMQRFYDSHEFVFTDDADEDDADEDDTSTSTEASHTEEPRIPLLAARGSTRHPADPVVRASRPEDRGREQQNQATPRLGRARRGRRDLGQERLIQPP